MAEPGEGWADARKWLDTLETRLRHPEEQALLHVRRLAQDTVIKVAAADAAHADPRGVTTIGHVAIAERIHANERTVRRARALLLELSFETLITNGHYDGKTHRRLQLPT